VFSKHFVDGKPTEMNPYPTLQLGYDTLSKVKNITRHRKLSYRKLRETINEDGLGMGKAEDVCNARDCNAFPAKDEVTPHQIKKEQCQRMLLPSYVVFGNKFYTDSVFSVMLSIASLLCFRWMLCGQYNEKKIEVEALNGRCIHLERENKTLKKKLLKYKISELKIKKF